ncbi:MAG: hypothetical protein CVU84_07825 [Firmicutes bacterium HGW-Firmicutes-1]|jgi:LysM repeat protein|nr:MAG: hypothetical protein CVU84_07825 [Firmicutes bacterium HGW-Firmicutes-1]
MSLNLREQKMDLLKPKGNQMLQMTFDEDVNVPDIKPDMDRILQTNAQVSIVKEELLQDRIILQGDLKVNILYIPLNDKKPIHSLEVVFPFEETINADGLSARDHINISSNVEDLVVHMLNSRKVNVKSISQLKMDVHEKKEVYITSDIEGSKDVEKKINQVVACQLKESRKDSYKIKDEVAIPSGKPNMMEVLWHETTIQNRDFRLVDGKLNLKGTIHLATLYASEASENNIEFVEHDLTFNGLLDCPGSKENMINDVQMKIVDDKILIRPDLDGEERVLSVEVDTRVDIKVYDEEQSNVLGDVYSLEKDLMIKKEPIAYQKLLCKNQSQTNIKETVLIDDISKEILQIYYASGNCAIENMMLADEKINIEGVLFCKIMYIAADDHMPINIFEIPVPFEHQIDIKGLKSSSVVNITPSVNYIGCTMVGGKEIEIKSTVQMNTIVFEENSVDIITAIDEKTIDMKAFQNIPGIVGYIVKDKESLWDIAKKYRTTIQNIKKANSLEDDIIGKGDKLIIVKELLF